MQLAIIARAAATLAVAFTSLFPSSPAPIAAQAFTARTSWGANQTGGYTVGVYDADILYARQSLDRFYGGRFQNYTAPGVSWINEAGGTATACGNLSQSEGPKQAAFYCPKDKVVYLDYTFLSGVNAQYGYDGVLAVMAHEYGHHIQNLTTANEPKYAYPATQTKAEEWQADCYSGGFMAWMSQVMPQVNRNSLGKQFRDFGDSGVDSPGSGGYSHGTPEQRGKWWVFGWDQASAAGSGYSLTACYNATYNG